MAQHLSRRAAMAGAAALLAWPTSLRAEALSLSAHPRPRPLPRPRRLIEAARLDAQISYAVLDADTGALLEGRDADRPVAPASTLKTVTALYALDRLGAGHRFVTRVMRDGDRLILAGGGDPLLDTDQLAELADLLVARGTTAPARFEVWGGALPRLHEIAPGQAPHLGYNPSVSGMMLNFNRVHLDWRRADGGYRFDLQARARRESPVAYTIRAEAGAGGPVFLWREAGGREIWTANRAHLGASGSRWLPVRRPELYAGDVFQTLCRARGLVLPSPAIAESLPPDAQEIARTQSAPLREIAQGMMEYSTNLTAEALGLAASGAGDLAGSAREMQLWAEAQGMSGMVFADHSGMSPLSRVTARAMARVGVAAERETDLRGLMRRISRYDDNAHLLGDDVTIRAKTGTLNFVSNLAGFADRPGKRGLSFAIYVGDERRRAATEGQELPAGVASWTARARSLHQQLIGVWTARYG
ncbi:MAG: D-alanyl-D-alanine carboxypeptidase/D-alanyl-D-alanine-endopeptidase [Paracoccus sp. (in: a-proteobacteria)]|nr:D-alanyl-D-alanine carboxypeptidase/D-alanyl-D-alanine-endopeptidase [Paracoccus sp. (in: a-proteobacteria)]